MLSLILLSVISLEFAWGQFYRIQPKTLGQPLPEPQLYAPQNVQLIVAPSSFEFSVTGQSCDILDAALRRYFYLTFPGEIHKSKGTNNHAASKIGISASALRVLEVDVRSPCNSFTYPSQEMDESYTLKVRSDSDTARLAANEVWGALRGLETFSQLVHVNPDFGYYQINETYVADFPRFSIRAFLIDSARHFLSVRTILTFIEALAQNKFNVLHWHIADDNSFSYQSVRYPNLSIYGAYNPNTHVYTQPDVRRVIEFARLRGVRVMVEWDTPAHAFSYGIYYRELLCVCCDQAGKPDGTYGPLDPTLNSTYEFMFGLFDESRRVFPGAPD